MLFVVFFVWWCETVRESGSVQCGNLANMIGAFGACVVAVAALGGAANCPNPNIGSLSTRRALNVCSGERFTTSEMDCVNSPHFTSCTCRSASWVWVCVGVEVKVEKVPRVFLLYGWHDGHHGYPVRCFLLETCYRTGQPCFNRENSRGQLWCFCGALFTAEVMPVLVM